MNQFLCFELTFCDRITYCNEHFRYHGTTRSCQVGDNGHTMLCHSSLCSVCSIIKTSFKVSLANPVGGFGKGIYTSSASNKYVSANYCDSSKGAMFVTKVVLGKVRNVSSFGEVNSCPRGSQLVFYNGRNGDEAVVYTNNAIRPVFLIVFG
ncbi:hypothetical protein PILCRDRAFT_73657 [Piloderma croceum F 1598]|uniref:PARP catalytic domain-containing protein n=1 Tax=Piloderma croceum (strain F 1598) TaxID=765440 RepID=A0A0C3FJG2_PILCF|nr:hypothetical protein PILCRDRAFT_73657 [Piloderma croceum F 1598]